MTILLGILGMGLLLTLFYFFILPFFIYFGEKIVEGKSRLCLPHNHHDPFLYGLAGFQFLIIFLFLLSSLLFITNELGKYIQENMFV